MIYLCEINFFTELLVARSDVAEVVRFAHGTT